MADSLVVNQSRVKLWRRCKQAHYFSYVENIVPRRKKLPLERGKMIHSLIEAHAVGDEWKEVLEEYNQQFYKLFAEERSELGDLPNDLKRMMKGYLRAWEDEVLEYQQIEIEVGPIKLSSCTSFKGKVDGLAKDPEGRIWLVEHKSHKKFPSESVRLQDMQTLIYVWALRKMGYQVDGILWDYIRTKTPIEPGVLKSGQLSQRKNMDTDYHTYRAAIKREGLNPRDYRDFLATLKENSTDRFYRRVYTPIQEQLIPSIVRDYTISSMEIAYLQETPVRTFSKECSWCDYFSLCNAEMMGYDTDFLRKADFVPKEDHYTTLVGDSEEEMDDEDDNQDD